MHFHAVPKVYNFPLSLLRAYTSPFTCTVQGVWVMCVYHNVLSVLPNTLVTMWDDRGFGLQFSTLNTCRAGESIQCESVLCIVSVKNSWSALHCYCSWNRARAKRSDSDTCMCIYMQPQASTHQCTYSAMLHKGLLIKLLITEKLEPLSLTCILI